jgi:uncharacterized protein (TIGR02466 family)
MKLIANQLLQKGTAAHKKGLYKEAEENYKKAIEFNPDLAVSHNNLGVLLKGLGRLEEAIVSFKKAIKLKSDYAECYNNLGISLKEIGKLDEAKISFIKAIKLNPKYVSAHHNLGIILQLQMKLEEAKISYSKVVELNPNFEPALLNRGQVLFDNREYKLSLRDFDACNSNDSKSRALASLYALGRIDDIYERINSYSKLDDENLYIAAFSSFINAKHKKDTANKFCKNPLDFIYSSNLSQNLKNFDLFITETINDLRNIKTKWEPSNKTTHKGFQSTIDLFKNPSKKISNLKSIILDQIDSYYIKFKNESCTYIKKWPLRKNLEGWHVILKQQGYQSAHIHPNSWLSGVIYLKVVPTLDKNEGAIEFSLNSRNYYDVNSPKKIYKPKVGDIILFPSSLHHRTIPFTTNTDRIIVSFDLTPDVKKINTINNT